MMKGSAVALRLPKRVQAHNSAVNFSHGPTTRLQSHSFLGNVILKSNVSLLNKNRNVVYYC